MKPVVKPTCRELLEYVRHCGDPEELAARVERVLALHRPGADHADREDFCYSCGEDWPCPTVRLLDGEEQ